MADCKNKQHEYGKIKVPSGTPHKCPDYYTDVTANPDLAYFTEDGKVNLLHQYCKNCEEYL